MEATFSLTYRQHANPNRLFNSSVGHKLPTTIVNRPNNLSFKFHQPSSCPRGHLNLHVKCGHKFRREEAHVIKNALEMNGNDDDGDYVSKAARGVVVGASVALGCVLGAMCLSRPMCGPALAGTARQTSLIQWWRTEEEQPVEEEDLDFEYLSLQEIYKFWEKASPQRPLDGSTVKALLETKRGQLEDTDIDSYSCLIRMKEPSIRFDQLWHFAWKLELTDKLPKAVAALQRQYDKEKEKGYGEKTYKLGLLLVEMLIHKGEYENAQKVLKKCMEVAPSSDATSKLYQAVISVMLDQNDAEKLYEDYKSQNMCMMQEPIELDSSQKNDKPDETPDFKEFKNGMLELRKKIKENTKKIKAAMQK